MSFIEIVILFGTSFLSGTLLSFMITRNIKDDSKFRKHYTIISLVVSLFVACVQYISIQLLKNN